MNTHRKNRLIGSPAFLLLLVIWIFIGPGISQETAQGDDIKDKNLRIGVYLNPGKTEDSNESTKQIPVAVATETLRGLDGVWVVVTKRDVKAEKYGLIAGTIQEEIESFLEKNNVRVLSKEQYKKSNQGGILCVDILPLIAEKMGYSAVSINVALMQNVLITTDDITKICQATTWEQRTVALCDLDGLREIPDSVTGFIDQFVKDFAEANKQAANPQKEVPKPKTAPDTEQPQKRESPQRKQPPRSLMI